MQSPDRKRPRDSDLRRPGFYTPDVSVKQKAKRVLVDKKNEKRQKLQAAGALSLPGLLNSNGSLMMYAATAGVPLDCFLQAVFVATPSLAAALTGAGEEGARPRSAKGVIRKAVELLEKDISLAQAYEAQASEDKRGVHATPGRMQRRQIRQLFGWEEQRLMGTVLLTPPSASVPAPPSDLSPALVLVLDRLAAAYALLSSGQEEEGGEGRGSAGAGAGAGVIEESGGPRVAELLEAHAAAIEPFVHALEEAEGLRGEAGGEGEAPSSSARGEEGWDSQPNSQRSGDGAPPVARSLVEPAPAPVRARRVPPDPVQLALDRVGAESRAYAARLLSPVSFATRHVPAAIAMLISRSQWDASAEGGEDMSSEQASRIVHGLLLRLLAADGVTVSAGTDSRREVAVGGHRGRGSRRQTGLAALRGSTLVLTTLLKVLSWGEPAAPAGASAAAPPPRALAIPARSTLRAVHTLLDTCASQLVGFTPTALVRAGLVAPTDTRTAMGEGLSVRAMWMRTALSGPFESSMPALCVHLFDRAGMPLTPGLEEVDKAAGEEGVVLEGEEEEEDPGVEIVAAFKRHAARARQEARDRRRAEAAAAGGAEGGASAVARPGSKATSGPKKERVIRALKAAALTAPAPPPPAAGAEVSGAGAASFPTAWMAEAGHSRSLSLAPDSLSQQASRSVAGDGAGKGGGGITSFPTGKAAPAPAPAVGMSARETRAALLDSAIALNKSRRGVTGPLFLPVPAEKVARPAGHGPGVRGGGGGT
jgi:hypothetical protein